MTQEQKSTTQVEDIYRTNYKIGRDNIHPFGLDLHNPVFVWSGGIAIVFIIFCGLMPKTAMSVLEGARLWITNTFDWLFLSAGTLFVIFCIALILLPTGKIRLGGDDARPEFSYFSWFAMLFAAGMGIGLVYWSVAEPVGYLTVAAEDAPLNIEGSKTASLGALMYHWGLHPWGIYGVMALSLAFFGYNKSMPMTVRTGFFPLLGDRVWGVWGNIIDTLATIATLFGLATSLGLGALQASAGGSFLWGIPESTWVQVIVIIGVTAVALWSVLQGVDGGVKVLSNINMAIAGLLLLFVIIVGSLTGFLGNLGTVIKGYAEYFVPLSNPVGREDQSFYHSWTIFFWSWWISWSPFVGMFIAQVSRGRTVREFLTAVLLVPTVVSIIWMAAFGGNGIDQAIAGVGSLAEGIDDESLSLFQMFENMPLTMVVSVVGIILALVFFVTSSDSGSLVVDSITSGGKTDAPKSQRVFWASAEGFIAAVLLIAGGEQALDALQAAAITTALPFVVVLLLMALSLAMALHREVKLKNQEAVPGV